MMRFDNPVETDHDLSYHRNDSLNKNYVSWTLLLIVLVLVEWSHLSQLLVIFNSFFLANIRNIRFGRTEHALQPYVKSKSWLHIKFAFLPKRKYMRLFSVSLQFLSSFFFLNHQWQQLIIKTKATDVFFYQNTL